MDHSLLFIEVSNMVKRRLVFDSPDGPSAKRTPTVLSPLESPTTNFIQDIPWEGPSTADRLSQPIDNQPNIFPQTLPENHNQRLQTPDREASVGPTNPSNHKFMQEDPCFGVNQPDHQFLIYNPFSGYLHYPLNGRLIRVIPVYQPVLQMVCTHCLGIRHLRQEIPNFQTAFTRFATSAFAPWSGQYFDTYSSVLEEITNRSRPDEDVPVQNSPREFQLGHAVCEADSSVQCFSDDDDDYDDDDDGDLMYEPAWCSSDEADHF